MSYDIKLKQQRVLAYLNEVRTQRSTAKVFDIGTTTIKEWKKQNATTGLLPSKTRKRKSRKIDLEKLSAYVASNPDAYLAEITEVFSAV